MGGFEYILRHQGKVDTPYERFWGVVPIMAREACDKKKDM